MQAFHSFTIGGVWMALFLSHGEASHLRPEEDHNGTSSTDDFHLQIASDPPVRATVDTLDCVLGESEKALERNRQINSEAGDVEMMDANAYVAREAQELRNEAKLHTQRAQELEGIKRKQRRRHFSTMKGIQENDQAEISKMDHELELLKEAESSAQERMHEEKHLLSDAETRASASKAVRLQQQNLKSRDEVSALIQYPILGFSLPTSVNPIEYLTKYSATAAVFPSPGSQSGSAGGLSALHDRGNAGGRTTSQLGRDSIEIFGDGAAGKGLKGERAGEQGKKLHHKKNRGGPCKRECNDRGKVNDEKAEQGMQKENNSGAKVLDDIEETALSPLHNGEESTVLRGSPNDAEISEDTFDGNMEDPDEGEVASSSAVSVNTGEKDDDDDNGDDGPSDSAKFDCNKRPSAEETGNKMNDSAEGECESHENQVVETRVQKAVTHNKGSKKNSAPKSPVEATQQEAQQAETLQQTPVMHIPQSFYQDKPSWVAGTSRSGQRSNRDIHTAIETARLRFFATKNAAAPSSSVDTKDSGIQPARADSTAAERRGIGNSEPERALNSEGTVRRRTALAKDELGIAEETSAAREGAARKKVSLEEEHKLLAAAEEAQQAQNGLKLCAHGSFLSCHREPLRRRRREL